MSFKSIACFPPVMPVILPLVISIEYSFLRVTSLLDRRLIDTRKTYVQNQPFALPGAFSFNSFRIAERRSVLEMPQGQGWAEEFGARLGGDLPRVAGAEVDEPLFL